MLGIGLLHMLPHSVAQTQDLDGSLNWMLIGLLGMFLLIRIFHFHEHGPAAPETICEHHEGHEHEPAQAHDGPGHGQGAAGPSVSWIGVAFGLSLHAFLDGVALGAAVISEASHGPLPAWAGMGVFLAVLLHKPLDALSITTLMQARGWSHQAQQVVNAGFAMTCPLGAWVFVTGVNRFAGSPAQAEMIGIALAISAGIFLCISLSDLLPEVQFHHHDRVKLSAALVLGVLCAYAIRYLEPAHTHTLPPARSTTGLLDPVAHHDRRVLAFNRLGASGEISPCRKMSNE